MRFEFPEDEQFFHDLLCEPDEDLRKYESLFDPRPSNVKRNEYNQQRDLLLSQLLEQYGGACQLQYRGVCDIQSGIAVDHLIPLSSNKLNKKLRHLSAPPGKKVPSQSFGSNHPNNLVIACCNCNNYKKHRFLSRDAMKRILHMKGL